MGIVLGFVVGLLGAAPRPTAAASSVTMKVSAGLGGWVRPGAWLPIDVELANEGPDVDAQVAVDVGTGSGSNGTAAFRTIYLADASLPRHSHKLIHLTVPYDSRASDLSVRLVQGDDTLIEEKVTSSPLETNQLLVAILSEHSQQALQAFGSSANVNERVVVPIWLDASTFPDRPEQLGSAEVVLLDSFPTADLTDAQRRALQDWVAQGGTLIAVGGGDWRRTLSPLPVDLLPVEVSSDESADVSDALARFAGLADGPANSVHISQSVVRDGRAITSAGSTPLIVVADRGLGRVAYVAADPMADPLASWNGASRLWHAILAEALPPGETLMPFRGQPVDQRVAFMSQLVYALSNFPSLEPPSLRTLAILLVGYVLLIGVVSHVVLGILRRRELGWITVPLIALAFTIGAYSIARLARGDAVVVSSVSLVRLDPKGPAVALSAVGAFAPGDADYRLAIDSPALPLRLPAANYAPTAGSPSNPRDVALGMRIREGDQRQLLDISAAAPWALRGVWLRHAIPDTGKIDAVLRAEGQHLRGTVTNRTRFTLEDSVILAGDSYVHLGTLPVGGSAQVDLNLQSITFRGLKGGQNIYQAYSAMPVSLRAGGASVADRRAERDYALKQPIFTTWTQASPVLGGKGPAPLYFVGWTNERLVPITQGDHPVAGPALDLITQPLELDLTGSYDVGPGLIPGRIVEATGAPPSYNGPNVIRLDRGAVTLEFLAPTPSHLETLGVNVGTLDPVVRGSSPFKAEVFDWTNGTWHAIDDSAIRLDSGRAPGLPPALAAGSVIAAPSAPTATPISFGATQVTAISSGGEYVITLDGPDLERYVAPTGLVRLQISSGGGSLSLVSPSLIVRGAP